MLTFKVNIFQIIATQNLKWDTPSIIFENCKFSIAMKINLIIIFSFLLYIYVQMCSYILITIKYVIDCKGLFWQGKEWQMILYSKLRNNLLIESKTCIIKHRYIYRKRRL